MGFVSTDLVYGLKSGVQTGFMKEFAAWEGVWPAIATKVNSTKLSEDYSWLNAPPMMREMTDERLPKALVEQGFTLTNKDYESSLEVSMNVIADDQYGQVSVRVRDWARRSAQFLDKMAVQTLAAGNAATYGLCYDGQYFFDTDHIDPRSEYQTNQSNYASGGGSALSDTTIKTGITAMLNFKDDRGEPYPSNPDTLIVGPALEWTARELLETKKVGGTTSLPGTNVLTGRLKVIVSPYITSATAWFLLNTSGVMKPIIYQHREGPTITSYTPDGDRETRESFFRRRLYFGCFIRGAWGYGDWRTAYMSAGA